ncbi:elongation factor P--(R)-beta-lysine ligase [Legionella sp. km772]|uniref:elongation factor P--(R)-beta-lysine ligase n=1 Tax=Legionella sp. km772 TaxID=2498111 RepID=UPI000F8C399B|nr:elongation factor P--(R)-beta-lysine ligase [Legionella sp. km772]RUR12411.1 elongation factor P--(R)-beta-lysine ligase [Legionella sp. km772]
MDGTHWQPAASLETLRQRAELLTQIRHFFTTRQYLEVDTPVMAHYGVTDPYLSNIKAYFRNKPYCLQTSPEYHMKRLLAAGSGPIFQLAKVFRDDELGRWHNPEFTLLEWYQLDINHHQLMDEMDLFLQTIAHSQPMLRKTYQEAFIEACDVDPFNTSVLELQKILERHHLANVLAPQETDLDQYLFLLMSHVVEPFLAQEDLPVAVYHFPPSQAALAQVNQGVAERFEIYYRGIELANGFHELTDVTAQEMRFVQDRLQRQKLGFDPVDSDPWLLQALAHGLPSCSGVALGIERLLALTLNKSSISEVMAFNVERA